MVLGNIFSCQFRLEVFLLATVEYGKCSHEKLCYSVDLPFCSSELWYTESAEVTLKYFTQGSESFFKLVECLN